MDASKRNGSNGSLGMIGGEIIIDWSQPPDPTESNRSSLEPSKRRLGLNKKRFNSMNSMNSLNSFSSIKGLLRINSISEDCQALRSDPHEDYSSLLVSDEESTTNCSLSVADSTYNRIHQVFVGGVLSKLDSMEHISSNGNRIVTSNQQVMKLARRVVRCPSESSIESSVVSESTNGSCLSLASSVVRTHKKTVNAFKKMDSRNHMDKQARVVKTCRTARKAPKKAKGDELIDRFLEKMASKTSHKSDKIKKNDSFKKVNMLRGRR
eukprot:scaffold1146_cov101-Cylindrotheca_fusiformis.AAC.2